MIQHNRYTPAQKKRYAKELRKHQTKAERALWPLVLFGYKRQVVAYGYIPDFFFEDIKMIVEVDGSVHRGREGHDAQRTKHLKAQGVKVIRVSNQRAEKHRLTTIIYIWILTSIRLTRIVLSIAFMP